MNTLFIDLASHSGLLACVTDTAVNALEPVDHRIGDHELLPLLEKLLKTAGWSYQDLTHIACVTGPGGFTSLRVAVALVNTLVHRLKIQGAGVHLSDLYFARAHDSRLKTHDFVWLHSTKKHELFVRGLGAYAKQWPEATHVILEEFEKVIPKDVQWVGELISEHEKVLQTKGVVPATVKTVEDVLPDFLAKRSFASGLLVPWYGRTG